MPTRIATSAASAASRGSLSVLDARLVGVDTLAPTILAWTQTLPYDALLDEQRWHGVWATALTTLRQLTSAGREHEPMTVATELLWLVDGWSQDGPDLVAEAQARSVMGSVQGPLRPPAAVYARFELVVA